MKKVFLSMVLALLSIAYSNNAMAEKVLKSFNVGGAKTLFVQNLFANVTVRASNGSTANVAMSGDKNLISDIIISQDAQGNIRIAGKKNNYNQVTIESNSGCKSVSITSNNVVVSGGDLVIVNGKVIKGGDLVIVNGKVIKGGNEKVELVNIEVVVPKGTNINDFHTKQLVVSGLNGKVSASLLGQDKLNVTQANGMYLECSEQSTCRVSQAIGGLHLDASDQSKISISGTSLLNVHAEARGRSEIGITANCRDFLAEASGESEIILHGHASGRISKSSSGQSEVSVE